MAVKKLILFPFTEEKVRDFQLAGLFTKYGIVTKCIYVSSRGESSFHQYTEGSAIMEFSSEHDALVALEAVQNGEIRFRDNILQAVQLRDDFSPIKNLTNSPLKKIFSLLPLSMSLDVKRVCKRWKGVAQQCKFIAIPKEACYSINCPLSLLGKHCENLENLTIDYHSDEEYPDRRDVDLRSTWRQFKNLARVMLKDIENSNCNFLLYLPETVMELPLIASPDRNTTFVVPINLSNLPNLQSLTLIGFELRHGLLVGFRELKKLSSLYIENCKLDDEGQLTLAGYDTLEYLAIKNIQWCHVKWDWLFTGNKNLKYLELSDMMYVPYNLTFSPHAFQHLKYLRTNRMDDETLEKIAIHGLPSLEYLDCQHQYSISHDILLSIVARSPNLKVISAVGGYLTEADVEGINSIKDEEGSGLLKFFVGKDTWYRQTEPTYYSPNFMVGAVPEEEDKMSDVSEGWFTKDWETIKIVSPALPLLDDSSPIQTMPTECLLKVFSYLSMHDWLDVQEVCPRWKSIVRIFWQRQRSFDIRKLRYPEEGEKCIEQCGENLETIYYYKDYTLSPISKYCSDVKNVTVDFQDRQYDGEQRRGRPDVPDLQPTLSQLKNLTCLTLKNVDFRCNCDFLQDLPETMTGLHISLECECPVENIDISKFVNLRALTFCKLQYVDSEGFVLIRGFEALQKLTYLCLEQMFVHEEMLVTLSRLTKIEYFSLRRSGGWLVSALRRILENNRDLKYLNLSKLHSGIDPLLHTISNLPKLQTLCLDDYDNTGDAVFDEERSMPSLEYFDYGTSRVIQPNVLLNLIVLSPKLRLVTVRSDVYDAQQVVNAAIRATLRRKNGDPPLKVVLGERAESVYTAGAQLVLACRELDEDERDVFEIQSNERFIKSRKK